MRGPPRGPRAAATCRMVGDLERPKRPGRGGGAFGGDGGRAIGATFLGSSSKDTARSGAARATSVLVTWRFAFRGLGRGRDRDLLDRALRLLVVVVGRAAEVGREVRRAVPFA